MTVERATARKIAERLLEGGRADERVRALDPRPPDRDPLPERLPAANDATADGLARRQAFLRARGFRLEALAAGAEPGAPIENHIGAARLPVGIVGPLRVNGSAARGDFYVPMATTEGAMIASYNRGAFVISQSGGAAALCLTEIVSRAPCFCFENMASALLFTGWALEHFDALRHVADATTRHGRLVDLRTSLIGKDVYLIFDYQTADAAGQNMVTFATDAVCRHLVEHAPVRPERWYIEGNLSGDKKATMLSFLYARGRKVVAEARLPAGLLRRVLRTTAEEMTQYWKISFLGGVQSGSIGAQGHYANALAAVFAACGQDLACVAEAAVGLTRMERRPDESLYVAVVLPNLIVGTVGGGTAQPTARECLELLGCAGEGGARAFAEIVAATVLAGEISIIAAMAAGDFAAAHRRYGRRATGAGVGTAT